MAEKALDEARKKLGLLNTIIFQDIQSAVFTLSAYLQLSMNNSIGEKIGIYEEKESGLIHKIVNSLNFAKNYQDLRINPSRWQNVNQVFLYAISHLNTLNIARQIRLENLEIFSDPLLEKVFFNLMENALLHGKTVTEITLDYREVPDGVILIMEDNGVGIPAEEKVKIFERGYGKHAGLGLYLAREVLSITGISIRETGEEGKRARFEMFVPKGAYRFSARP